jgi:Flp pilus assembly protein TadG
MSRATHMLLQRLRALPSSRRGALAPIAALTAVVLVFAAGSAVDVGRAARVRSLLQDIADSAALAGAEQNTSSNGVASATAYVSAAVANLSDRPGFAPATTDASNYSWSQATNSNGVQTTTQTVKLTATLPTTLMSVVMKTLPISVSATAQGVVAKKVTITLSNYSSDAADHNVIYGYGYDPTVYSTGNSNLYPLAPALLSQNLLLDNRKTYPANYTTSFYVGLADNFGFALSNTTGTSQNCYGLTNGTTTIYYSHRLDTSGQYHDYPTASFNWCGYSEYNSSTGVINNAITQNQNGVAANRYNECQKCVNSYQNYTSLWNTSYPWKTNNKQNAYIYAATASRNPLIVSNPTQDCTGAAGATYSWDDNGGGSDSGYSGAASGIPDDDDHNDMDFTVNCNKAVQPGTSRLVS